MRNILIIITGALIALASSSAFAQDEPAAPSSPDDFCATAPGDILSILQGDWSFKQGPGFATAGAVIRGMGGITAIPLPSHAPVPMKLTYDPETGFANLSGENPDGGPENMIMFPSLPENLPTLADYLIAAERERLVEIGSGCDWDFLPIMVGTNRYSLDRAEAVETGNMMYAIVGGEAAGGCVFFEETSETRLIGHSLLRVIDEIPVVDLAIGPETSTCERTVRQTSGEFHMTIVVKFQSLNSGAGMVIFEGQSDGHRFAAKAPITLTR